MIPKTKPIRSQKLRDSARLEDCTLNIPGACNHDPTTVVLCHLPDESHGMSRKSDDICVAYGCYDCHSVVDGRRRDVLKSLAYHGENIDWYIHRAMVRTWRRMIEKGLIKIG